MKYILNLKQSGDVMSKLVRPAVLVSALFVSACSQSGGLPAYVTDEANTAPTHDNKLGVQFDLSGVGSGRAPHFRSAAALGAFSKATIAQAEQRHNEAAKHFINALQADPSSHFLAERAFYELLFTGHVREASVLANRLVHGPDKQESEIVALMDLVEAFYRKDWDAVLERFEKSKELLSRFPVSSLFAGWSHAGLGDLHKAALAIKPKNSADQISGLAPEFMAYMLDYMKRYEDAETAYKSLIERKLLPSLQPIVSYAELLRRQGKDAQARRLFREQSERYAGNDFLKGEMFRIKHLGRPSHRANNPHGAMGLAFYRMGIELAQANQPTVALIYLQIANHFSPDVTDIHILRGQMFEQFGAYGNAANSYAEIDPRDTRARAAHIQRIRNLHVAGDVGQAMELAKHSLTHAPENAELLRVLGDMYRFDGDSENALSHYSRAIAGTEKSKSDKDWELYYLRSQVLDARGQWVEAEADLLKALKLNPDQPDVLNYLGYRWIDLGQHLDEARGMIERAAAGQPRNGYVVDSLGWMHYLLGNYQEAVEFLEQALALEPIDSTISDHLGDAYWRVGRRLEARYHWRHALENGPDNDVVKTRLENKLEIGLSQDIAAVGR